MSIRACASVEIVEVSPRDGLQNESVILSIADKVELIRRAVGAGVRRLEVGSFVNPIAVPQMADTEAVVAALPLRADVVTIGLALNERGVHRALATAVTELGLVCAASDGFGMKNQGKTSAGSLSMALRGLAVAHAQGRRAQATIAVAFGCPFEGAVDPARVVAMARALADAGAREIGLADTIGVAAPGQVESLVERVVRAVRPLPVRAHFHDTRNTGGANVWAAVRAGATTIDASIAGIGGCPFAPLSSGNVATEDIVYLLERSGVGTELDLGVLVETALWLSERVGSKSPSKLSRVGVSGSSPAKAAPRAVVSA